MRALQHAIEPGDQLIIRDREPGDLGWLVERHGVLYTREYGWDESFERLVAQIAADFDPQRDRAWIAEHNGRRAGAVLCVHHDDTTAKLRTLLVEPSARGLGLGTRLVQHVIKHAKAAGYDHADAVDQRRPARRPAHLRARGVHAAQRGPAPRVRPRPDRADVVA